MSRWRADWHPTARQPRGGLRDRGGGAGAFTPQRGNVPQGAGGARRTTWPAPPAIRANRDADVLVFLDAVLSERPEELPALAGPIADGHADFVLGASNAPVRPCRHQALRGADQRALGRPLQRPGPLSWNPAFCPRLPGHARRDLELDHRDAGEGPRDRAARAGGIGQLGSARRGAVEDLRHVRRHRPRSGQDAGDHPAASIHARPAGGASIWAVSLPRFEPRARFLLSARLRRPSGRFRLPWWAAGDRALHAGLRPPAGLCSRSPRPDRKWMPSAAPLTPRPAGRSPQRPEAHRETGISPQPPRRRLRESRRSTWNTAPRLPQRLARDLSRPTTGTGSGGRSVPTDLYSTVEPRRAVQRPAARAGRAPTGLLP